MVTVKLYLKINPENNIKEGMTIVQGNAFKDDNVEVSADKTRYTWKINDMTENTYTLKQGDIFTVTVTNKDKTIAQILKGAFYKIAGNDTYAIAAKHTGIVNVNG